MIKSISNALLYLLVYAAVQIITYFGVLMAWGADDGRVPADQLPQVTIVSSAIYSLILLVIFLACRWCVASRTYLRSKPVGVLFWVVIAAVGTFVPSLWLEQQINLPDDNAALLGQIMASPWGYLAICIFAPLVEEVVFRGAILRTLLDSFRPAVAIIASALVFAIVHLNWAQMPHAFLMGLLLGWMYWRTGSIIPGILLHWINNTLVYVLTRLFPGASDMTLEDFFGGDQQRVLMAVGFSLCMLLPALFQLNQRMKKADTPSWKSQRM